METDPDSVLLDSIHEMVAMASNKAEVLLSGDVYNQCLYF